MEKELGKIMKVYCGIGVDKKLGVSFTVKGAIYTANMWIDNGEKIYDMLVAADKEYVEELINVPVEITWENSKIKDFRILTEVL